MIFSEVRHSFRFLLDQKVVDGILTGKMAEQFSILSMLLKKMSKQTKDDEDEQQQQHSPEAEEGKYTTDEEGWDCEEESETEPPPSKKLRATESPSPLLACDVATSSSFHVNDQTTSKLFAPVPTKIELKPLQTSPIVMEMKRIERELEAMGRVFTSISYFYHITKPVNKERIVQDKILRKSRASLLHESVYSPANRRLEGVFFGCNKVKRMLPFKSPYGTQRLLIPIKKFGGKAYHLFFNSHHKVGKINYIVLVLVNEDADDYQFCCEKLIELDIKENSFLCLDFDKNSFTCCQTQPIPTWVELLVLEEVVLEEQDGHLWDTVTDRGRNKSGRKNRQRFIRKKQKRFFIL